MTVAAAIDWIAALIVAVPLIISFGLPSMVDPSVGEF